jgi:hypothetical protein
METEEKESQKNSTCLPSFYFCWSPSFFDCFDSIIESVLLLIPKRRKMFYHIFFSFPGKSLYCASISSRDPYKDGRISIHFRDFFSFLFRTDGREWVLTLPRPTTTMNQVGLYIHLSIYPLLRSFFLLGYIESNQWRMKIHVMFISFIVYFLGFIFVCPFSVSWSDGCLRWRGSWWLSDFS